MSYFVYRVYYHESISLGLVDNYLQFEEGIVAAEDPAQATANIYKDFGITNIMGFALVPIDTECLCLSHNDIKDAMDAFTNWFGDDAYERVQRLNGI